MPCPMNAHPACRIDSATAGYTSTTDAFIAVDTARPRSPNARSRRGMPARNPYSTQQKFAMSGPRLIPCGFWNSARGIGWSNGQYSTLTTIWQISGLPFGAGGENRWLESSNGTRGFDCMGHKEGWKGKGRRLAHQSDVCNTLLSSRYLPTICKPIGNPCGPRPVGIATLGTPHKVQIAQKSALPVDAIVCGGSPVAGGVAMASNSQKSASSSARITRRVS